jgi:DNA-binding LacI/PurR family transcriptional regulator
MATIKEVAERSSVSVATVSYILNNRTIPIRDETRERVLKAMRELNYRPQQARLPRSEKRTGTIGVIYPNFGGHLVDQVYYTHLLDGILFVASECAWNTLLLSRKSWDDAHKNLRSLCDGNCDGLVLFGPPPTGALVGALRERGIPFVLLNTGMQQPGISCVDIDNEAAAFAVAGHLIEQGHRRIAMLPGGQDHDSAQMRVRGFERAMKEAGLVHRSDWILPGTYEEDSGYRRTLALLRAATTSERPTALFCGNDPIARGAYKALAEQKLSVPADMSVIGIDDQAFAATMEPPLTSLRQPLSLIGERAVRILLSQIEEGAQDDRTVRKEYVPVELIRRGSVAPPAGP